MGPLVVSWGFKALFPSTSAFLDHHQLNGTRGYSAFLTIPTAINFMETHNWWKVAADSRQLLIDKAPTLCEILGAQPLAPLNGDYIYQLFSARIHTTQPEKLHDHLRNEYKIQVPVMRQESDVYLRYSINGFNDQSDLDTLFDALRDIKKKTNFIIHS